MATLLHGHSLVVAEWAGDRLGGVFRADVIAVGILDKRGVLRGAFVLDALNDSTAELTVYSERAVTAGTWREFCRFAFDRFERMQIHTPKSNKIVKKGVPKLGWKFECSARDYYGRGQPALVYSMTRETCRCLATRARGSAVEFSATADRGALVAA